MPSFQHSPPTAAGALYPAASVLSPRALFQSPSRNQKASKALLASHPPPLLLLPDEVLGFILGFADVRTLTAFSLCSRECLQVPTDTHWEALYCQNYQWLVNRKPSRLSWRSFTQRLHEAAASTTPDKCGRVVILGTYGVQRDQVSQPDLTVFAL